MHRSKAVQAGYQLKVDGKYGPPWSTAAELQRRNLYTTVGSGAYARPLVLHRYGRYSLCRWLFDVGK